MEVYHKALALAIEVNVSIEIARLSELEMVIERGLQTFYEVGEALLEIRDSRLYRNEHATFEDYCQHRWQMTHRRANYLIQAAEVMENLGTIVPIPTNESQVRPLTTLEPDEQKLVWQVVEETAPDGKITAAHVKSVVDVLKEVTRTYALDNGDGESIHIADAFKAAVTEETYERMMRQNEHIRTNGTPKALQMSDSNEWYTPAIYIEAARELMNGIDTDPASNDIANQIIQAETYYTIETNGFDKNWHGRVWLNPPYGRDTGDSNQALWSARLIEQYRAGITSEAVLLINAVTDRKWFQGLWNFPICFTDHRIKFYDESGEAGAPTHGNALVYMGHQGKRFAEIFKQFGVVVVTVVRDVRF